MARRLSLKHRARKAGTRQPEGTNAPAGHLHGQRGHRKAVHGPEPGASPYLPRGPDTKTTTGWAQHERAEHGAQ